MRGWKVKAQAKAKNTSLSFKVEGPQLKSEAEDGRRTKTEDGGRRTGGIGYLLDYYVPVGFESYQHFSVKQLILK